MKKILVVSYSQSGQLADIVANFLIPFKNADIDFVEIEPVTPFPFPWDTKSFYDVMPETVLEEPIAIKAPTFKHSNYDLIVFGYQPWYLSPAMPATAMLKNSEFCKRLKNTPIITLLGARNMWLNAQESIKALIKNANGLLVGNVPLIDKTFNLISVITIVHWLGTGKKTKKWGIFPLPGVAQKDIEETTTFGVIAEKALQKEDFSNLQNDIIALNKIQINTSILFIESRAKKLFKIWANTIKKKGTTPKKRATWLMIFRNYLYFALFIVSPVVLTIYTILFRPLTLGQIKRKKEYFCSVKLNENG
ncbi:MAG: hypothetical protein ACPGSL_00845 [Vicingaceae bacterium]